MLTFAVAAAMSAAEMAAVGAWGATATGFAMALFSVGGVAGGLAYQLADVLVAAERRVEAGAWLNTAYNLGVAAGTGAGGFLAVRAGSHVSFAIIAAVLLGCALAALRRRA